MTLKRWTWLWALGLSATAAAQQYSGTGIRIGVLTDMNGVYSGLGGPGSVRAAQMAADDFSKEHKEFAGKITVVGVDHQNKADVATNKTQEMVERDGVDAIFDVPNSACALAASEAVRNRPALLFVITGGTSDLTNDKCSPHTFHWAYDNYALANGSGTAITKKGGKSWFIIYPNYAFGQNLEKQFRKAVESNGGKLVGPSKATPFPNTDFSSYLLEAQSLKPQVFGTMQAGADLVNVVKQYNEFGMRKQNIALAVGLLTDTDIDALGQDAYGGAQATVPWFWNIDDKSRAWSAGFEKQFGKKPTWMHGGVYSAVYQYLDAVRRAKTDETEAVRKQLEGHAFEDFYAHHAKVRAEDHRTILDMVQVTVKAKSAAKGDRDYFEVIDRIPAEKAFTPLADSTCKMVKK